MGSMSVEQEMERNMFTKIVIGEPLSIADAKRFIHVLRERPPQIEGTPEQVAPLVAQLREMLHQVYLS